MAAVRILSRNDTMSGEVAKQASPAEAARRKAEEADRKCADTIEEIKGHFAVLLELRDRRIKVLEEELGRRVALPEIEADGEHCLDFKVMVVVDSAVLRTTLVAVLQRRFRAFSASDRRSSLEGLAEKPDLVLLGPDLSRGEVMAIVRRIRRVAKTLPIMVMCRPGDEGFLASLEGLGVVGVLHGKYSRLARTVAEVEAFCRQELGQV